MLCIVIRPESFPDKTKAASSMFARMNSYSPNSARAHFALTNIFTIGTRLPLKQPSPFTLIVNTRSGCTRKTYRALFAAFRVTLTGMTLNRS